MRIDARQSFQCWMLVVVLGFASPAAWALDVAIVSSSAQDVYARFVQALLKSSDPSTLKFEVFEAQSVQTDSLARKDVVLAVGFQSAQTALGNTTKPVFAVMLSDAGLQSLKTQFPQATLGGIVLDQPLTRHLALFKAIWPHKPKLGVLLGRKNSELHEAILKEAAVSEITVKCGFLQGAQGSVPVLEALLDGVGVILAPPDPDAFSAQNARVILLTTYRAGVPVLSFSASAVEAGALAAVFSSPENIAQQATEWLKEQKASAILLPDERMPKYFDVQINRQVARSLKQDIPATEIIVQRMREINP